VSRDHGGRALLSGTVTFLFTDIEGSTRLLKRLGRRYEEVLNDQQALLRESFARFGGSEVDTQGDAFFVVFGRAIDAVRAAVDAQRAFAAHDWRAARAVRVRIGIHTGEPEISGERYVGLGVHRGARICGAAHGGQVLLSSAARELVHEGLPDGVELRDLGHHSLKDLDFPEHIFQLVIHGLRNRFPPLRDADGGKGERSESVRLILADDAAVLREGVARLLADEGFEIVAQAGDAEELLRAVRAEPPDVVIVDIRMPPTHTDEGLRAARAIRESQPDVGIVVLSQHVDVGYAMSLLAEDSRRVGYLLKDRIVDLAEFAAALRHVSAGGAVVDPSLIARLMAKRDDDDRLARLAPTEREILALMAEGRTDTGIGQCLGLAPRSVETYAQEIFKQLEIPSDVGQAQRVQAVLAFLRASPSDRAAV
jgi:DNA-binding NarL/FixJ family response regulator/class 3 adenylate cyclase